MTGQRHAITFRVKPGTEEQVAEILASYGRPDAQVDSDTRLLSTTILMKDTTVVRIIEIEGSMLAAMQHLGRQPAIRAVEEAINPYLVEDRDLNSPAGVRGFFVRAMMDDVGEPSPVQPPGQRPHTLAPYAVLYRFKGGRGGEAEGCFSTTGGTTSVFRHGDDFVRFLELSGGDEEALEHMVSVALEEGAGQRLQVLLEQPADLSDAAGWRVFLRSQMMRVVTQRVADAVVPLSMPRRAPAAADRRGPQRVIDFHCHLVPARWGRVANITPSMLDVDGFFARKEADGVSLSVLINAMFHHPWATEDFRGLDAMKEFMEFANDLRAKRPGRVTALIGVNPFLGDAALRAMEDAMAPGGFPGVTVNSSTDGQLLDDPAAADFWALAARLDVPVFLHPPLVATAGQANWDPRFLSFVMRPLDVALGAAAIVTGGVMERHPGLRIVLGSGGGALSSLAERLDLAYSIEVSDLRSQFGPERPEWGETLANGELATRPSAQMRNFFVDTCVHGTHAFMANLDQFGPEKLVFGTDSPPLDLPISPEIKIVESLLSSPEDQHRVLYSNAASLLGLEEAGLEEVSFGELYAAT